MSAIADRILDPIQEEPQRACLACHWRIGEGYAPNESRGWWWTGWEYICNVCMAGADGKGGHVPITVQYWEAQRKAILNKGRKRKKKGAVPEGDAFWDELNTYSSMRATR